MPEAEVVIIIINNGYSITLVHHLIGFLDDMNRLFLFSL
jgi:hypothetical protein